MPINYPASLPLPLQTGYDLQTVSPLIRTQMQSGRSRQRRAFTYTPQTVTVSWLFTESQAALFENFFQESLTDGQSWFFAELQSPLGVMPVECRFVDVYNGPSLIGFNKWNVSATLETRDRQTLNGDWATIMPGYILLADIFDYAINREWPNV